MLHLQCADFGQLTSGQMLLEPDTVAWRQAKLFARFYKILYDKLEGDEVAMYQWLRARLELLKLEPLLMMVDHDQLESVIRLLESGHDLRHVNLTRQGDNKNS